MALLYLSVINDSTLCTDSAVGFVIRLVRDSYFGVSKGAVVTVGVGDTVMVGRGLVILIGRLVVMFLSACTVAVGSMVFK